MSLEMRDQRDLKLTRQFMRELGEMRPEMAAKDYADLRNQFGGHIVELRLKVLVPVRSDCWLYEAHNLPDLPHASADSWELDLVLLGFSWNGIQELKADTEEGIGEERGPGCHYCHRWLPYREDEEGCFTQDIKFADYFGFVEKEGYGVSKAMRKPIIQMYGRRCFAYGTKLRINNTTIDHIVPRSEGGTGSQVNLQVLCQSFNNTKRNTIPMAVEASLHFPMRPVPSDAYQGATW